MFIIYWYFNKYRLLYQLNIRLSILFKGNKMNVRREFFLTLVGAFSILLSANANAQFDNRAILYKIHDIRPIKNHEAQVVACEFDATFFNRTDLNMSTISLEVSWKDDVIESTIDLEKKEEIKNSETDNNFSRRRGMSKTESLTSRNIGTSLSLPPLASQKQIVVTGRVDTDRCFLLIEDVNLNVKSCKLSAVNKDAKVDTKDTDCKDLFKYISSMNPEYYTEFKSASYQEQQREEMQEKQKEKNELNSMYNKTVSSFNRVTEMLGSMK